MHIENIPFCWSCSEFISMRKLITSMRLPLRFVLNTCVLCVRGAKRTSTTYLSRFYFMCIFLRVYTEYWLATLWSLAVWTCFSDSVFCFFCEVQSKSYACRKCQLKKTERNRQRLTNSSHSCKYTRRGCAPCALETNFVIMISSASVSFVVNHSHIRYNDVENYN